MPIPKLSRVTSSNIHSLGHDGDRLYVKFRSGGLYSYPAPREIHDQIAGAESPGSTFHKLVRNKYDFEKHE